MPRFRLPALSRSALVRLALAGATALAAGAAVLAPSAAPARPSTAASAHRYVALGDSYGAGVHVLPWDGSDGCGRSYRTYPHQIGAALGLRLTDVTCGAAEVGAGVLAPQPLGRLYGPPSVPPPGGRAPERARIEALSPATGRVGVRGRPGAGRVQPPMAISTTRTMAPAAAGAITS